MTHRFPRIGWSRVLSVSLIACLAALSTAHARSYWYESYESAVRLIDSGRLDDAAVQLGELIQEHPYPAHGVRVTGTRFIDYLPYYQRARIELARGEFAAASHSLDVADAFGAVDESRRTRADFLRLRQEVDARTANAALSQPEPATRAVLLSDTP
ncbi:MAG: hypothetical protein PVF68_07190 [Acidobacteriota bacterium]|jgi:hypothetical protein